MKKITLIWLALMLGACSDPASQSQDSGQESNQESAPAPAMQDEGPEAVARQVAAAHSGVEISEVAVISVTAVDFPNAGLGCPDPDMSYAAVITPGHQVEVLVGDETIDVRVAGEAGFVCKIDTKIPEKEITELEPDA